MSIDRRTFLKQSALGALQLGMLTRLYGRETDFLKKGALPRSSPEDQGFSSRSILDFVNAVDGRNLHSLMIVRNGHVIAEGWWAPYAPEFKHTLYSLSKSFTSTAIGMAVGEGKLSVDDKVISFFPDRLPGQVSGNLAGMRVRHLLSMSTGHAKDTTPQLKESPEGDWIKTFLARPVDHEPGTLFVYNSGATYMLSAILQKVTGQHLTSYLAPRLFEPLGITDFDWETDAAGIETGGWGLRVKTEDIARFGQLYLQEGIWNGKTILSSDWIKEATTAHILQPGKEEDRPKSDWLQGYGYQFWRCRHNCYRGDGAYGQYCVVMPDQKTVIAITGETSDMQLILNHAWEHLLNPSHEKSGQAALRQKLASLSLPVPDEGQSSLTPPDLDEELFSTAPNALDISQMSFKVGKKGGKLVIVDKKGRHTINFGINEWRKGETTMAIEWLKLIPTAIPGNPPLTTRAYALRKDPHSLEITCRFIDTAHYMRLTCTFEKEELTAEVRKSVAIISNDLKPYAVIKGSKKRG
ncbi:MAG: serine hydrolase [Cytophagaceae bacterium SCN 52-12]|nr:MAG: serine hydrolase [Cytophagaceae bacterium SCN 52-12]